MSQYKLCYVEGNFAYFTTQELDKQWGDDWNDAPYEHNAGEPYTYFPGHEREDVEPWSIEVVAYKCHCLETPAEIAGLNSSYSVQKINKGFTPWLVDRYYDSDVVIPAGVSIEEFTALVQQAGGEVFTKVEPA